MEDKIRFFRKDNDSNGNPRYVTHFLSFITDKDLFLGIQARYNLALRRAKTIGGKKYNNKQFGGGIVFQTYEPREEERMICEMLEHYEQEWSVFQFGKMKRAITSHFKGATVKTLHGDFIGGNFKQLDERLGFAYTSSSMCAMFSICNTTVYYHAPHSHTINEKKYRYVAFVLGVDGIPYALLEDERENEKVLEL